MGPMVRGDRARYGATARYGADGEMRARCVVLLEEEEACPGISRGCGVGTEGEKVKETSTDDRVTPRRLDYHI